MKHYELGIACIVVLVVFAGVLSYISHTIYHRADAPLEQFAEKVLEDATGIHIDFSEVIKD